MGNLSARSVDFGGGEKKAWKWILGGKVVRDAVLCPESADEQKKTHSDNKVKTLGKQGFLNDLKIF
jgi:hypothetical protein